MDNDYSKYILIGSGILISTAALWFLSRDETCSTAIRFNPKIHTTEALRSLYQDMFVEGATLYC